MFTLKNVLNNNGATLNKAGEELNYTRGYQVSIMDMEVIKARDLRKRHLLDLLNKLDKNECLGIWVDNGKAYIDKSALYTRKREALKEGKRNKQISVWNWGTKEALYL